MKQEQLTLFTQQKKYIPLVVKISPDITSTELESMADIFLQEKIDGVIATNTTMTTTPTEGTGGLSGQPLMSLSTTILKKLHERLQNQIPIIGCGGIFSPEDAHIKLANGARLLQIYTGLIYQGPGLISEILSSIPV
jgi:dihydroorotate dehydrogenase